MKKPAKTTKKRLILVTDTIQKLDDKTLENVVGGGSCLALPPPVTPLES